MSTVDGGGQRSDSRGLQVEARVVPPEHDALVHARIDQHAHLAVAHGVPLHQHGCRSAANQHAAVRLHAIVAEHQEPVERAREAVLSTALRSSAMGERERVEGRTPLLIGCSLLSAPIQYGSIVFAPPGT